MLRNLLQSVKPTQTALLTRGLNSSMMKCNSASPSGSAEPPDNVRVIDYDDPDYLPVPEYPMRPNEPLDVRKSRLLYQSRKRGMLENDLLLSTFAARYLKDFNAEQTALYDQLINGVSNDWDIYYWATDTKPTPEQYDTPIMAMLKKHVQNVEKESRIRQPDIY